MAFRNARRGVLRQFKITGSTFDNIPELEGVSVWGWGFGGLWCGIKLTNPLKGKKILIAFNIEIAYQKKKKKKQHYDLRPSDSDLDLSQAGRKL